MAAKMPLILSSNSPRRRELLSLLNIPFMVDAADVDETCSLPPKAAVAEISQRKAQAGHALHPEAVILSADTLVSLDDIALGKPKDEADAFDMLRRLSGRQHQVYTGVTVCAPSGQMLTDVSCSQVTFDVLSDVDIRDYIATGEPMDKAGSYALQGEAKKWITDVQGSTTGVIGLPLEMTRRLLTAIGLDA